METGRRERYRETLKVLGRGAGLSSLVLATLASEACGPCAHSDDCARVDELIATRKAGAAGSGSSAGSADPAVRAANVATANQWDGMGCPTPAQYDAIISLKEPNRYNKGSVTASKVSVSGQCCYHYEEDCYGDGRPFLVKGERRLAALVGACATAQVSIATAQAEHASVAAFARLSLQLLSHGAPSELVRDAQLASLDELRHAACFFELASIEAGTVLRAGPLEVTGALDDLSFAGLIESNLREGCIGETQAAEQLRERAASVLDPAVRATLLAIADDELRHAELAFRILAWCRDTAPELTRAVLAQVLCDEASTQCNEPMWQHVLSPLFGALTA